jgi:murein L,D-transpeptidase YcbB/YkuD
MASIRAYNWLAGFILAGVLAFAPAAHAQPLGPWAPFERGVALHSLHDAGELANAPDATVTDEALSTILMRLAQVEMGQRLRPSAVDRLWAIEPVWRDIATELAAARKAGRLEAWLADLSPPEPGYRALLALAQRYRRIAGKGGWPALPKGPALRPGDRSVVVPALRSRLAAEGYGDAAARDVGVLDPPLRHELIAFQRAHSLPQTGGLDAATRAALDVPAQTRLAQIEANLERWRWLPHTLPADRLELDVAGQSAVLFDDGAPVLEMKVIVGDPRHRTPMFVSRLTSVVFDPPWNVPSDIAKAEILPKAAKDPGYLARNDFVWVDDRLQQLPGPKNALGDIKFDLPSPFGVYLHDTPARSLFARSSRALSHGCMRLEKPQALAEALLTHQGWTPQAIAEAVAAGHTQVTPLRQSLPLYVLYWTVVVQPDGEPQFRPDIYGWDRKLSEALAGATGPVASVARPDTLCAVVTG